MTQFWTGGYGPERGGAALGIGALSGEGDRAATTLSYRGVAATAPTPSWLVQHPTLDVLYAALQHTGQVQAFARTGSLTLAPLGAPVEAGEAVCHLAVNQDAVIASCYGDGRVVRLSVDATGRLGPATIAPAAEVGDQPELFASAAAGRVSRAHAAAFLPDGRLATSDLGLDRIRIWRVGAKLVLDHEVALPLGVGPRHLLVHPSGHLHVITEYSCEVFTLAPSRSGRWEVAAATGTGALPGDAGAEISRTRDGEFLHATLRGSNTVATLRVRGAGERVEATALSDTGVDWPRHHLFYDDTLLVAGQRSHEVSVIDLDSRTGTPTRIRHRANVPSPTAILPMR